MLPFLYDFLLPFCLDSAIIAELAPKGIGSVRRQRDRGGGVDLLRSVGEHGASCNKIN